VSPNGASARAEQIPHVVAALTAVQREHPAARSQRAPQEQSGFEREGIAA